MKETVLDVLMYLFDNYMESDSELSADEESLRMQLVEAGFSEVEIGKAFSWLEGLAEQQGTLPIDPARSVRVYTSRELERINVEGRGFLLFLEQIGVLDPATRELTIDRLMALEADDIDLDHLKWVVLMVLFNQPGHEAALAWMEDLVFNTAHGYLH